MIVQIILLLVALFLIYQIITYVLFKINSKNHPYRIESWFPFLGNIIEFGKNPVKFVEMGSKLQKDGAFTTRLLGKEITFLTHPRHYGALFRANDDECGTMEVYKLMTPIFGKGLVYDATSIGVMMEQLNFVTSGLTTDNFRRYAAIFEEETMKRINLLPEEGEVNIFKVLSVIVISTATRCLLGDEIRNFIEPEELTQIFHDLEKGINPLTFFFPSLTFLPGSKARDAAKDKIFATFKKIIKKRRETPEIEYNDTLDFLVKGRYKSGEELPDDHIAGILVGGLFAGEHTSSVTTTWTLFNIMKNETIKEKVFKEQREVIGNDSLTYDKYKNLNYLFMCVKETLRLSPPIIIIWRLVKKERKLDNGMVIPVGNIVAVSPTYTHRIEEVYKNANTFEPERFEKNRSEQEKVPFTYLPFGSGRHKCIGENFGLYQVVSILSVLLRKLDIKMIGDFPDLSLTSLVAGPVVEQCTIAYKKKK